MDAFEFATPEGAREVAAALGIPAEEILEKGQDWEYTFPSLSDLPRYQEIYDDKAISESGNRVLGCFIFECLEDHLRAGGEESVVRSVLSILARDYPIHRNEFYDWSHLADEHYERHPEDGSHIMNIVREFIE